MNIELHIEELVLHGFPTSERHHIAEAMQHELTRLLNERGLPVTYKQSVEMERVNAGGFQVAPNAKAGMIGHQVASTVYRGLSR